MSLREKTKQNISEKQLFEKGEKVVLGVSGGVDSVVLLDVLNSLRAELGLEVVVAHLNHGLRGEADGDEDFVRKIAEGYGNKFYSKKVSLSGKNIEEEGREARYLFFDEVLKKEKAKSVAVAHNADDQTETVILNLVRGAGINGLVGMDMISGNLKRPFLNISREEIEKYANQKKLKWREDESNKDLKYDRNRVRLNILPELQKINPKAKENILRSTENLREADNFLKKIIEFELSKVLERTVLSKTLEIDLKKLGRQDKFVQKQVIILALKKVVPKDVNKIHIEAILGLLEKTGTKEISLPFGFTASKIYDKLIISKVKEKNSEKEKKELKTELFWDHWKISRKEVLDIEDKAGAIFVDASKVGSLYVRSRKDGDYLFLKEKNQKQKLSDLFINSKISREERHNYPVLVSEKDEIVCVPLLRVSEKYRAKANSGSIIKLTFEKDEK